MAEAFFGTEAGQYFIVRVKPHTVSLEVACGHFFAKIADPVGNGVTMISRIDQGFFDLLDDHWIWRIGRVAHAEVDDVNACDSQLVFSLIDGRKQIRRQPADSISDRNCERVVFKQDF